MKRRKRGLRRIAAFTMAAVLAGTSVEIPAAAQDGNTGAGNAGKGTAATAFSPLEDEIRTQELEAGAAENEINFPDSLTVTLELSLEETGGEGTAETDGQTEESTETQESASDTQTEVGAGTQETPDETQNRTDGTEETEQTESAGTEGAETQQTDSAGTEGAETQQTESVGTEDAEMQQTEPAGTEETGTQQTDSAGTEEAVTQQAEPAGSEEAVTQQMEAPETEAAVQQQAETTEQPAATEASAVLQAEPSTEAKVLATEGQKAPETAVSEQTGTETGGDRGVLTSLLDAVFPTVTAYAADVQDTDVHAAESQNANVQIVENFALTGIIWVMDAEKSSAAEFSSDETAAGNTYTYVPVLPETVTVDDVEYTLVLGENVELPEITAVIEKSGTGDFTVTGGELGTDYTYEDGVLTVLTGTSLTIRNTDAGTATTDRIYVNAGGNITLAGVNIDVSGMDSAAAFEIASGSVTITLAAGTANILKSGTNCAGLQTDSGDGLTITGGGSLEAEGGAYGAGIGGGKSMAGKNITISGGEITATAGFTVGGAGIGGGDGGTGEDITITGGSVYATGGYDGGGAGVGGGNYGAGRSITITDGTVTAISGPRGAGIGGGQNGAGEYITIYGGMVTALGKEAGIGGGTLGIGSHITISGGIVTAEGMSGAGIGGGTGKSGLDIVISGGIVTAKGNWSAGVGGGYGYWSTGNFSTGENGSAFLVASSNRSRSITDNDDKSGWSGIIFEGSSGAVYGDITLPAGSYTVPDGSTLTIPIGSSLGGEGILTGNGTFQDENLTEDMVSVPEDLVYGGEDLTETIAERLVLPAGREICGQTFAYCWTTQVEKITDLEYQVTYTSQYNSENTFTKTVTAERAVAGVRIDGGETVYFTSIEAAWEAAQGNTAVVTLLADVQAGETLTVTSGSDITLASGTDSSGNPYTLSGNVYNAESGLINVVSGGTLTLESGTVENGAGGNNAIAVNGGHFVLNGGTAAATADGHSGVCVYNRGTAEIKTGNVSGDIGVATASDGSTITISDGTISGRASGVYVSGSGAKITITGGSISASNTKEKNGADGAALRIQRTGSALLSGGTYSGVNGILIDSGNSITLKELLDVSGDVKYAYYSNGALVTEGLDGKTLAGSLTVGECGHSYSTWADDGDGKTHSATCVVCGQKKTEAHDWDTDGSCKAEGCTAQAAASVKPEGGELAYYSTIEEAWKAAKGHPEGATVTLLSDVTVSSPLIVDGNDNITLTSEANYSISGNIPYDSAASIPAIIHVTGGALTFQSGTINSTNAQGEGIRVTSGTLNMKGGTIYAGGEGILVAGSGAMVNIESGSISGESRGLSVSAAGKVTLSGGTFSSTSFGNAVFCYTGKSVGSILEENYAYKQNDTWVSDTSAGTLKGTVTVEEAPIKSVTIEGNPIVYVYGKISLTATATLSDAYKGMDVSYQWEWLSDEWNIEGDILKQKTFEFWADSNDMLGIQTFACEVTCDGYTVTSEPFSVQVIDPNATAYTITIPKAAVAGGEPVSVGINTEEPFNLNGGTVSVSVSEGIDRTTGKLTLTNTDGSGSRVTSEMYVGEKSITSFTDWIFATFTSFYDDPVSISFQEPEETNAPAGTYEGTVTFSIDYTAEGGMRE